MRPSIAFLVRFFLLAALSFGAWSLGGLGDAYSRVVIRVAEPGMRLLTGFHVAAIEPRANGLDLFIARGMQRELVPLQPREVFSGIIPFLTLLGASSLPPLAVRLKALAIGLAVLFVFHVGLMWLAPYLATAHVWWVNKIIDVVYGFYGLLGYAALPFLLWFWLTRPWPGGYRRQGAEWRPRRIG